MYHVLVPVDTDANRALTQAACVTELPGAPEGVRATVTHARKAPGEKRRPVEEVDAVDRTAQVFDREDIPVETVPSEPPAAEGIVATADRLDVDHIVMGSHNRSTAEELLLGSVTKEVIRHTEVPVTVTGPGLEFDKS